ncbi:MAG: multicomponent Na+:H+ antiporter subunit G [Cellvibrionaceae bacterium]|jgi:multicomponent Na+:H+ antiporter subunit G
MVEILSSLFLVIGVIFIFVGALGVLTMQDIFMRMSASTKTTILGTGFMLIGVIIFFGDVGVTGRAIAIFLFILATAPVSAHLIGRAAYSDGVPLWEGTKIDELRGKYDEESQTLSSGAYAESDTWKTAALDDHVL